MIFRDAIGDFGIGIGGSIGMFLPSERKNDGGVVAACRGKLVGLIPCSNFEAGPFAPEIDSRGGFDDIGNVRAADAGGDFNEIELAVRVSTEELGVSDSSHQA